ncbi:DinB family protein [Fictibacillus sp. 18YEL24]|uniref:DinB family protein n=1 Tax=Fictibacillus sp. 18YEL24 TaxID=2745875 RepID=UPI0018CE724E|nr:DinB family protein [Fictibacillus sp. 18YEL24]MBH0168188.1 DinB family protein [Fictibacillus sp. 18YEL24]
MNLFRTQYDWVRLTRETLFQYCETLSPTDYAKKLEGFSGESILSLHAHVAGCYQGWLGNRALGKSLPDITPGSIHNVQEMRELFRKTDELVYEFLDKFENNWDHTVEVTFRNGSQADFTALWLFTHTMTHEFHHKGQIVKIGRQLGYAPPDTDLIEPMIKNPTNH